MSKQMTGAKMVVQALKDQGVEVVAVPLGTIGEIETLLAKILAK